MIIDKEKSEEFNSFLPYLIFNPTNATEHEHCDFLYKLEQAGYENAAYPYQRLSELGGVSGNAQLYVPRPYGPNTLLLDYSVEDENVLKDNAKLASEAFRRELYSMGWADSVIVLTSQRSFFETFDSKRVIPEIINQVMSSLEILNIHKIGKLTIL